MYNLLIGIAAGIAVTLAILFGTTVGWVGSIVPGLVAAVAVYFVAARRTWKKLEALFEEVQRELQAQRLEKAVKVLERGFALAPWQFLVASQVHAQIGVLQYVKGDLDAALPHLEKAFSRHWLARAMLGAARFRRNDMTGMQSAFEQTVKTSKKEGLAWAAYAWCLESRDRHDEAVKVLGRAVAVNPGDEKLKTAFSSLQNGKKLKLGKLYGEQWYQFRLEPVPPTFGAPMGPAMRGSRRAIYGKR